MTIAQILVHGLRASTDIIITSVYLNGSPVGSNFLIFRGYHCQMRATSMLRSYLFRIILDMIALELDELLEPEPAQRDTTT